MTQENAMPTLYPLSKSQREQFVIAGGGDADADVNTGGMLFWFDSDCADAVLERAVNLIVEREQALRLRLTRRGDDILQYETPYAPFAVPTERTGLSREELAARERRLMKTVAFTYDDALCGFKIIRSASAVALRACFHHVIMDGRSLTIFGSRLYEYVALLRKGKPVPGAVHRFTASLEPEQTLLEGERRRADEAYWRETTRDWTELCVMAPAVPAAASLPGRELARELEREYGQRINEHCRRFDSTPAYLFQAALAVYLFHVNPGIRFADMGQTVAARQNALEKETLGNYALELFLRIPVAAGDTLSDVERAVRDANFKSLVHFLCTYEDIVALKRESAPGTAEMRDLMFTYIPPAEGLSDALDVDWLVSEIPETGVEFFVFQHEERDSFAIVFNCRDGLYPAGGAEAAFDAVMALVDLFLTDAATTVEEALRKCMTT